jgi:hypothetical protein
MRSFPRKSSGLTFAFATCVQEAVLQFNSRSKVDAVRQKVETVKNTMSSNIDKARVASSVISSMPLALHKASPERF